MEPLTINEETRRKGNLRVLQRLDLSIIDIMGSATHVVLYEFNELSQEWEKRNVEGSLFVVKRLNSPNYKLIIMNRNSKENMYVPMSRNFQMQVRKPYLIFRGRKDDFTSNAPQKIRGIWFHDGNERKLISNLLETVMRILSHDDKLVNNVSNKDGTIVDEGHTNKILDYVESASVLLSPLNLNNINNLSSPYQSAKMKSTENGITGSKPSWSTEEQQSSVFDRKTLQLSLMSLLQDDRFLDIIHAQYLKVANVREKKSRNGCNSTDIKK